MSRFLRPKGQREGSLDDQNDGYALCSTLISSGWMCSEICHVREISRHLVRKLPNLVRELMLLGIQSYHLKNCIVYLCFRVVWFNFASPFCFVLFWLPWIDCSSHNDGTFELCYVFTDLKMTKKVEMQLAGCFFRDSFISVICKPNNSWDFRESSEVTVVVWTSVW